MGTNDHLEIFQIYPFDPNNKIIFTTKDKRPSKPKCFVDKIFVDVNKAKTKKKKLMETLEIIKTKSIGNNRKDQLKDALEFHHSLENFTEVLQNMTSSSHNLKLKAKKSTASLLVGRD